MGKSSKDISKVFQQRLNRLKQKSYTIQHLLELIDTYDVVRRSQCKIRLIAKRVQETLFHRIAEQNYNELFDYAVKIKANNPNLPNVPKYTGEPDYGVSRLRQWAVNAQNILSGKALDGGKAGDTPQTMQNTKRIIAATLISFIMILLFEFLVHIVPFNWIRNHPRSYGIQGSIICLIPCLIIGYFKPGWRKRCWGTAAIAFLVGLLSLL